MARGARVLSLLMLATMAVPAAGRADGMEIRGHVLAGAPGSADAARRAWLGSNGDVNGVAGYVFEVPQGEAGASFRLSGIPGLTGFEDFDVTFYPSVLGGTPCASFEAEGDDTGTTCGAIGVVTMKAGANGAFVLQTFSGVALACDDTQLTMPAGTWNAVRCEATSTGGFSGSVDFYCAPESPEINCNTSPRRDTVTPSRAAEIWVDISPERYAEYRTHDLSVAAVTQGDRVSRVALSVEVTEPPDFALGCPDELMVPEGQQVLFSCSVATNSLHDNDIWVDCYSMPNVDCFVDDPIAHPGPDAVQNVNMRIMARPGSVGEYWVDVYASDEWESEYWSIFVIVTP